MKFSTIAGPDIFPRNGSLNPGPWAYIISITEITKNGIYFTEEDEEKQLGSRINQNQPKAI